MTIDEAINDIINSAKEFQLKGTGELYKNFLGFLKTNNELLSEEDITKAKLKFKALVGICSQQAFNRVDNEK